MKKCYTCQVVKPLTVFNKNKGRKDGLNSICKQCSKARSKQYYQENTKKHLENVSKRQRKTRRANQAFIAEFLSEHPCTKCKETDIRCLEFDHLGGKIKDVTKMASEGYSRSTILKEIDKCQILCANCHSKKTHDDCNSYKSRYRKELLA